MKLIESSGKGLLTPSKAYYPHLQPYISPVGELIEQAPQQTPFHSEALTTNNTIIFEYSSTYTIIIILAWRNEPTPYISPKRPFNECHTVRKTRRRCCCCCFLRRARWQHINSRNPIGCLNEHCAAVWMSGSYLP